MAFLALSAPIFLPAAFFLGLAVGSFLNVVIIRGARGEGLGGRSRCMACGKILSARELIPIASFLRQKGRCRSCGAALSLQYPIVEALTALLFLAIARRMVASGYVPDFWSPSALLLFPLAAALIVLVVSDVRFQILPDGAVATLLFIAVFVSASRGTILPDAAAACAIALFFAGLWFFSRGRWMGLGDAKLALATSLAVGFPASLAAFVFSFWLGAAAGMVLFVFGKKGLKSRIPFGPFIIAGACAAYFFSARFLALTGLSLMF